ncbi:TIGR00645 family protein [Roseomonas sp. NAR14]|uniref:UPF0114 protein M0638_11000 n=1 Tax=Roseomonas acroporae TaxID=2937791 RepID=A0A9X1Y7D6_9PROT|nr:TIGR00645 family protein [Roseomonas acroporae]MCK8784908.1 TIGR00645 family protein [Roseomonas acroporae]
MERFVERCIVVSRWLLVPFYLGLILALVLLFFVFAKELLYVAANLGQLDENRVILGLLSLIDLTFAASLTVIVIFSGYENMVSRLDTGRPAAWPIWLTTVDFAGLKRKLFASMAAISAVALLKGLMKLDISVSETQLTWLVIINVVFIVGYVLMAVADWLIEKDHGAH